MNSEWQMAAAITVLFLNVFFLALFSALVWAIA